MIEGATRATLTPPSSCAATTCGPYLWVDGRASRIETEGGWIVDAVAEINDRGTIVGHAVHPSTGARGPMVLTPID